MANPNVQGVRPTQAVTTDFGSIMERGLNRAARNRAEQRLVEDREEAKKKRFRDEFGIPEEEFMLEDTEFRSINDVSTEAVGQYRDLYYDTYKQLEKDPNNIDLQKKLGNIRNSVKKMKATHGKFVEMGEKGLKMLSEGKMSGVDEKDWQAKIEAYDEGRVKVRVDDRGDMQMVFYGKDGSIQDVASYKDLANWNVASAVDIDSELDALVKRIGTDTFDENTGRFIRTENLYGDKQRAFVNQWVDAYLGTDEESLENNDVLADLLYQATNGQVSKKTGITEDERQMVRQYLLEQAEGRYDQEVKLKERPYAPQRGGSGGRRGDGQAIISVATDNERPEIDNQGNFVFSLNEPRILTAAKSDVRIQSLKGTADGRITLVGEDRQKVKGNPNSPEEAAEVANVSPENIFAEKGSNGVVTYYTREPFEVTYKEGDGENNQEAKRLINAFASQTGFRNENGLRNGMYNAFLEQYGKEVADRYFGGDLDPRNAQQTQSASNPTAGMTPQEKVDYYLSLTSQ